MQLSDKPEAWDLYGDFLDHGRQINTINLILYINIILGTRPFFI
jgi:hypothetical protein